jgi:hypothetical protein
MRIYDHDARRVTPLFQPMFRYIAPLLREILATSGSKKRTYHHHRDITAMGSLTEGNTCLTIIYSRIHNELCAARHRNVQQVKFKIHTTYTSLSKPNSRYFIHHASQRRRFKRQRPHRGSRHCTRQLWRRTSNLLRSSPFATHELTLRPQQTTLQHAKTNVAPMPEVEKGEGTYRHLP